jgi:hypothetical protein
MNEDVEFIEDKTYLTALPDTKIPEKSIEGWFYKHLPGSIGIKKLILLCVIIILFALSIILLLMSRTTSVDSVRFVGIHTSSYDIL